MPLRLTSAFPEMPKTTGTNANLPTHRPLEPAGAGVGIVVAGTPTRRDGCNLTNHGNNLKFPAPFILGFQAWLQSLVRGPSSLLLFIPSFARYGTVTLKGAAGRPSSTAYTTIVG